jgi:hypothetical protein
MLKNNKNICRNLLNLDSSKVKLIKKELNSHKISLLINNSDLNNISIKKDFLLQDEELLTYYKPKELNSKINKKHFNELIDNKVNLFFRLEKDK